MHKFYSSKITVLFCQYTFPQTNMFGWHPLDPFGFGRLGYERAKSHFAQLNAAKEGTVVAVTGANSGLGFALTQELAKAGCTVHMLCRSLDRAEEAKSRVSYRALYDQAQLTYRTCRSCPMISFLSASWTCLR
jgi:hypothetical protein